MPRLHHAPRALDTGVHLEWLLPRVAHRQWTLSLPFSVRFNVVKQPKLLQAPGGPVGEGGVELATPRGAASWRDGRVDGLRRLLLSVVQKVSSS